MIYIHIFIYTRAYNLAKWASFMGIMGKGRRDARVERRCGLMRADIAMRGERHKQPLLHVTHTRMHVHFATA